VPVAVNAFKIRDAKDEGGDFYRLLTKQNPQYQGLYLATPDGRLLAAPGSDPPSDPAGFTRKVLADVKSGLSEFGTITPRRVTPTNSLPYRGIGVRADGSVTLAISDKSIPVKDLSQLAGLSPNQLYLDSVTLSAAEWRALAPPDARAGSQWTIPEDIGRRFFPLLNPHDMKFGDPAEVTDVQFVGRVASVRDGIASLVYGGRIAGTHRGTKYDAYEGKSLSGAVNMVGGVGAYDIQAGQMRSLTWVWHGMFWPWYDPYSDDRPQPGTYGAVVEWRRGDAKASPQLRARAPGPEAKVELADSTPEDALKTFLVALAAQDEATLRGVTLPHADFDLLLNGPPAPPDQLALWKAKLEEKPMKRLKEGDPVRMADGETRVIKPDDVREGRVVLWPSGAPLPSRLENVGGHWKVFAAPFIAARKSAVGNRVSPVSNPQRSVKP